MSTLYDKIWENHIVSSPGEDDESVPQLIFVDRSVSCFSYQFDAELVVASVDILFMRLAALRHLKLCGRQNVSFAAQIAHWLQLIITFRGCNTPASESFDDFFWF